MQENENVLEEEIVHEEGRILTDEENPLRNIGAKEMGQLLTSITDMINVYKDLWQATVEEFDLKEDYMKQLHVFNENHYDAMPDGLSIEEKQNWDRYNGIDKMTELDVKTIFGESHKIYGDTFEETMSNIKEAANNFFSLIDAHKEYNNVEGAYREYARLEQETNIQRIQKAMEVTEDPEKKAELQNIINTHYSRQYISFVTEPLDDEDKDRIVKAFSNTKTVKYWLDRAEKKLETLKVHKNFFFLLTNIEKDYLDEKYHPQTNTFMLYFLQMLVFKANINDPKDEWRSKVASLVLAVNSLRRNQYSETEKAKIIENLNTFSEQFYGLIDYDNNTLYQTTSIADQMPQVRKDQPVDDKQKSDGDVDADQ